jgi:hypothetical protein
MAMRSKQIQPTSVVGIRNAFSEEVICVHLVWIISVSANRMHYAALPSNAQLGPCSYCSRMRTSVHWITDDDGGEAPDCRCKDREVAVAGSESNPLKVRYAVQLDLFTARENWMLAL